MGEPDALKGARPVRGGAGEIVRLRPSYSRTHEGWLYLAVVVDLFSRKRLSGWSAVPDDKDIVLNALLMAVWRRNPEKQGLVHSDQGSRYTKP